MSLRYKMAMSTLKMFSNKEIFKMPYEEMLKNLHVYSRKQKFKAPSNGKCVYGERTTKDGIRILTMQVSRKAKSSRAVLFLTNGEYVMHPDVSDAEAASDIAKASGCDLWMPYFPLLPDCTIRKVYDVVLEVYVMLSAEYGAENVNVLGSLSGGALALGLVPHMNVLKKNAGVMKDSASDTQMNAETESRASNMASDVENGHSVSDSDGSTASGESASEQVSKEELEIDVSNINVPRRIIAVSPTCVPMTEEEKEKMSNLSDKDIMVDSGFLSHRLELFCRAADDEEVIPDYMLNPSRGDLTGQPQTHIYFGGAEVLSALAPAFEDALTKYNVPHTIVVEKDMCHGYALMNFFPEGSRAYKEIIRSL